MQVGEAFAGGLVSGAIMGGGFSGIQTIGANRNVTVDQMPEGIEPVSDRVTQNPTAGNVGQSNNTVQAANNQANASTNQAKTIVNQEDVAKQLTSKGFNSQKVDAIAKAITARLNGRELTRSQRDLLSNELNSSAVRDTISDIIRKKADGIDSAQEQGLF